MSQVVPIKGEVNFTIILDPSVWIFDKRKIDLEQYLLNGEIKTVDEREVSGTYGIPFFPFIMNAEPTKNARQVICHQPNGALTKIPLDVAQKAIICFAKDGRPLREEGPIHLYFSGEQRTEPPIQQIISFEVTE